MDLLLPNQVRIQEIASSKCISCQQGLEKVVGLLLWSANKNQAPTTSTSPLPIEGYVMFCKMAQFVCVTFIQKCHCTLGLVSLARQPAWQVFSLRICQGFRQGTLKLGSEIRGEKILRNECSNRILAVLHLADQVRKYLVLGKFRLTHHLRGLYGVVLAVISIRTSAPGFLRP